MSHQLDRITVRGFRSLADVELRIRPLNVLIGQNGAGKSNFVELFTFVREVIEERLQRYTELRGGAERLLFYGSKTTSEIQVELRFPPNGYDFTLEPTDDDRLIFVEEHGAFKTGDHNPYPYREQLARSGDRESGLGKYVRKYTYGVGHHVRNVLQDWRVYHFHDTSRDAAVKKLQDIEDAHFLKPDAANLAPFLRWLNLKHPKHYKLLLHSIRGVLPFFKDFVFRPSPFNDKQIRLEWQDKHSDIVFSGQDLSDGSLRFICLATLLLQPELPSVVLLDEPELGLHPTAIEALARLLKQAAARTTVIVSTQSVNLVSSFAPEDVVVVDRDAQGASVLHRLEPQLLNKWLEEYSLGELWEKNILGGKPQ
ncbi:AAA family ATPase [Hymenobacter sp. B81]|uniref:AAA family ATPase n=1 Tax=Hymenobacter sp. B81 TaxID=3344878 RepID=UPI0037DC6A48